ncbi:Glycosyltransferase involved in cell wall bisynthesis [Parafrankia irregularis]|uniref:Glycosyltransferase involved in cell wall bisynthesis n=1 Tax=Parafrankia irregularis TaxID=795642 RepID=A0A0S4R0U8_9ACTN|nr:MULTISPECIES: glycosyltransferase family 2 protein [Parafrankia]MBE3206404.1 glycosyltransferase [Parafrankia sp. CH37]CUU60394.1 Glycosyltransferase involved in cell wall bisynthesis [Parafrankia irregularis]
MVNDSRTIGGPAPGTTRPFLWAGQTARPDDAARPDGSARPESTAGPEGSSDGGLQVSVVMPCLNEAESVGVCVGKALAGLAAAGVAGEVVVVDNGSTDDSAAVATAAGARVVREARRGYGNAYLAGFAAARGRFLVMGDSDDTYDFSDLGALLAPLRAGRADYVLGSRFAGEILPGAMPWLHRYVGNPVLTGILNRLFDVRSSDAHSGMRAFTSDAYRRMRLRCEGMELASELVIAAGRAELRMEEVPITYHPRVGASKLHSLRDGWRHLRFMLLLAPRHLFVLPGLVLLGVGAAGQLALLPGALDLGFHRLDLHFSVLFALFTILGWQLVLLGVFADVHNHAAGWPERRRWPLTSIHRRFSLERGLALGGVLFAAGLAIDGVVLIRWLANDMGPLNELRPALLAMSLMVLGTQTAFGSFFLRLVTTGPSGGHGRAGWAPLSAAAPSRAGAVGEAPTPGPPPVDDDSSALPASPDTPRPGAAAVPDPAPRNADNGSSGHGSSEETALPVDPPSTHRGIPAHQH